MKIRPRERGATLIVALILLVLLTLFGLSALTTSTTSLKVIGNMQASGEAMGAAQEAIETVISSPVFITSPSNAILNPCGTANTLCTDVNGDGTTDYTTQLVPAPACVAKRAIQMSELNLSNADDVGCTAGQAQTFGVTGANTGDSLCGNTTWEITAQTTGNSNGASATVVQGVSVRISTDNMSTSCL